MLTAYFEWFLLVRLLLVTGCVPRKCIPVGMRQNFFQFSPSRGTFRHCLYRLQEKPYAATSDSILRDNGQSDSGGDRKARLRIAKRVRSPRRGTRVARTQRRTGKC